MLLWCYAGISDILKIIVFFTVLGKNVDFVYFLLESKILILYQNKLEFIPYVTGESRRGLTGPNQAVFFVLGPDFTFYSLQFIYQMTKVTVWLGPVEPLCDLPVR